MMVIKKILTLSLNQETLQQAVLFSTNTNNTEIAKKLLLSTHDVNRWGLLGSENYAIHLAIRHNNVELVVCT